MSDRRRARRHKSRRQNLCSKACTPTNALAETKSVSSPPEKSRRKLRRSRSSAKTRRSAAEGRLIKLSACGRWSSARTNHWVVTPSEARNLQFGCPTTTGSRPTTAFMKRIRYSKYVPDPAGEMSMEDLLSALSDFLLQSGFQNYLYDDFPEGEQTLDDLREAIEQALMNGDLLDERMREQLQRMQMEGTLDELIEQLIERMQQEDYISIDQPHDPALRSSVGGQVGE